MTTLKQGKALFYPAALTVTGAVEIDLVSQLVV